MPRNPRNAPQLSKEELDYNAKIHTRNLVASAFNTTIRFGALVLIARYGYLSVEALSGEMTIADIGMRLLANVNVSNSVAWLFGMGGVGYGYSQRRFRLKANEVLGTRVSELEQELDPGRSSSKLTRRGQTNPKDLQ